MIKFEGLFDDKTIFCDATYDEKVNSLIKR